MTAQKLKFWTYRQNNSGGSFDFDHDKGISVNVIVQATDAEDANHRAERIGLYFDGDGDCECCGSRWYETWTDDPGDDVPSIYGVPVHDAPPSGWSGDDPDAYIHYIDGRVEAVE